MNGFSIKQSVLALATVAAVLLGIGMTSMANATQYKVGDRFPSVDIRVSGNHVTGYRIFALTKCANDKSGVDRAVQGKMFGNDDKYRKKLRHGQFVYSLKTDTADVVINFRVKKNEVRGGYRIKSFADEDGIIDTCWTGKGRRNAWVKFVAPRR